jgi:hypothetical protein
MEKKGKFLFMNRDNVIIAGRFDDEEGPALQLHRGRHQAGLGGSAQPRSAVREALRRAQAASGTRTTSRCSQDTLTDLARSPAASTW